MSFSQTLFVIFILLIVNSFFSIAEYSIASSRKMKLEQLIVMGNNQAKKVLDLMSNPNHFITVIQVGLNIIAILSGIFGDHSLAPIVASYIQKTGLSENTSLIIAIIVSVLVITSVFIIFSELIPKQLAFSNPEAVACKIINILLFILSILKPFVWLLSSIANNILKFCNISTVRDESITFEEVSAMINQSAINGLLEKNEHHLIENVFSLTDRNVMGTMTPRSDIIFFDVNATEEEIHEKVLNKPHTRFLVCDSEIDNLLGYIESATLLKNSINKKSVILNREKLKEQGLKTILTIPDSLNLLDVLDKFRETRQDIAVIINEFGMVLGLITLNDILGTLMGSISSMADNELIVKRAENSWLIDGSASIEDVKRLFGWDELPGEGGFETISGFLMFKMKCIPKKAQALEYSGIRFEIMDVEKYRIDQVMATIIATDPKI